MRKSSAFRRALAAALLTAPLFTGECVEVGSRSTINGYFAATNLILINALRAELGLEPLGTQTSNNASPVENPVR